MISKKKKKSASTFQIFLDCKNPISKEWQIIELQGTLNGGSSELSIGDFFFNEKGIPFLQVGNHLLEGKLVDLQKPLVVVKKLNNNFKDANSIELNLEEKKDSTFQVSGIVKRKYLFKTRPRILVNK